MRLATLRKIEACHAEIARLIKMEQDFHDRTHPDENKFQRHFSHNRLSLCRLSLCRLSQTDLRILQGSVGITSPKKG